MGARSFESSAQTNRALRPEHASLDGVRFHISFEGVPRAKCRALAHMAVSALEPSFGGLAVSEERIGAAGGAESAAAAAAAPAAPPTAPEV